jgi:hypothetical protein
VGNFTKQGENLETHLLDVLAFQFRDQLLDPGGVGFNTTGFQQRGDVGSGGRGVTTELEEKVGGDVLHSASGIAMSSKGSDKQTGDVLEMLKGLVNRFKLVTEQVYVNA